MISGRFEVIYNVQMYDVKKERWITNGQKHPNFLKAKAALDVYSKKVKGEFRIQKTVLRSTITIATESSEILTNLSINGGN